MEFYFPYQNNTYLTYPYSLCFTNISEYNIQQWIQNHTTQIQQPQNEIIAPIYTRVEQREERKRENIIIQPLQKYFTIQHTVIDSNSANRQEPPNTKKPSQKQSRNVFSNLLRIFFKNILELHTYTHLINRIIRQHCMATSEEDFYVWLQRFGINFKNYIKLVSVRRVVDNPKRRDHVLIFSILLRSYVSGGGKEHCLSSKRIDKSSIKMHLEGLRQLAKALSTPTA